MIYTGTETRNACYSPQHLQLYESYSIIRLLENTAPGRNGGGWIDQGGSSDNLSRWLDQANATMLAKAKELMLFNFCRAGGFSRTASAGPAVLPHRRDRRQVRQPCGRGGLGAV